MKNLNTVINCRTESQAKEVLSILDKQGYKWQGGDNPLNGLACWNKYEGDTCYRIDEYKEVRFCHKKWYEEEGYNIITVTEFLNK